MVNVPQVRQGPPDNPSLGTIALNWQPPECELCESWAIWCLCYYREIHNLYIIYWID